MPRSPLFLRQINKKIAWKNGAQHNGLPNLNSLIPTDNGNLLVVKTQIFPVPMNNGKQNARRKQQGLPERRMSLRSQTVKELLEKGHSSIAQPSWIWFQENTKSEFTTSVIRREWNVTSRTSSTRDIFKSKVSFWNKITGLLGKLRPIRLHHFCGDQRFFKWQAFLQNDHEQPQ